MSLFQFIKSKLIFLIVQSVVIILFVFYYLNSSINFDFFALYIQSTILVTVVYLFSEFMIKYDYFTKLKSYLKNQETVLELLSQLPKAKFQEAKLINEVVDKIGSISSIEINNLLTESNEYRDFVEMWVHEIKAPLASILLIIDSGEIDKESLRIELNKIDMHVEKALYYARTMSLENDYFIKKHNLSNIVNSAIKSKSFELIRKKTKINSELKFVEVFVDKKWLEFIICQIIDNSIKYSSGDLELYFKETIKENHIELSIKDNGIGIEEYEKEKIFTKAYTGEKDRARNNSTGIGLYLVRKLCEKMHLDIYLKDYRKGSFEIVIKFPVS